MQAICCPVCSLPREYCEFGPSPSRCKAATLAAEELGAVGGEVSTEAAAAAKKPVVAKAKPAAPQITIKRVDRGKSKIATIIGNISFYDLDCKAVAKKCATKFACGASCVPNVEKKCDDIVVQGDCCDAIVDYLVATWQPKLQTSFFKRLDEKKK